MSGIAIDDTQLRGPWETAQGFLIDLLQLLAAQLAPVFPLVDGIQSTANTTAANPIVGLSGYPSNAFLITDSASVPSFSAALPGPLAFLAGTILTPAVLTVNTNDYAPAGLTAAASVRLAATGAVNLTGLHAASNAGSKLLINISAFTITITHADVSSAAANRFRCPGAANLSLTAGRGVWIWYDTVSDVWQVMG
jgi:hypothetical protein